MKFRTSSPGIIMCLALWDLCTCSSSIESRGWFACAIRLIHFGVPIVQELRYSRGSPAFKVALDHDLETMLIHSWLSKRFFIFHFWRDSNNLVLKHEVFLVIWPIPFHGWLTIHFPVHSLDLQGEYKSSTTFVIVAILIKHAALVLMQCHHSVLRGPQTLIRCHWLLCSSCL